MTCNGITVARDLKCSMTAACHLENDSFESQRRECPPESMTQKLTERLSARQATAGTKVCMVLPHAYVMSNCFTYHFSLSALACRRGVSKSNVVVKWKAHSGPR